LKKELEVASSSYEGNDLKFFYAVAGQPTDRLRDFAGIPKAPILSIVDFNGLIHSGKYLLSANIPITSASILNLVSEFKNGKLTPVLKSGPRPENDKHPTHPTITQVVADSFEEVVLKSPRDVLLDVYADWCGPCVALAPIYALLADTLQGLSNIIIAKIDRDQNDVDDTYIPEKGIPNVKFFPASDKKKSTRYQGNRTLNDLLEFLHENATEKFDLEAAKKKGQQLIDEANKKALKNAKKIHSAEEYKEIFDQAGNKLIVVDFYAAWCGPCKTIAPAFADYSEQYLGAIFLKLDVDEFQEIASEAGINSMPTFQLFKNGKRVELLEGADKKGLEEAIKKHI